MLEFLPKTKYTVDGIDYDIVDIFKKLEYTVPPDQILTTTVSYGERPDQISQRLYGTPKYYWSIILANKTNPFIDPIDRLGENTKTTGELEAGEDIDPRDFFIQFSRSSVDLYIDDINPDLITDLGLSDNSSLTDHRVTDFYKFVKSGDIIAFEPQNENLFSFGAGQQKLGATSSYSYSNQYGQSIVPESLIRNNTSILDIAAGDKFSAALDTLGWIHFWGSITGSNNYSKIDDNYYKSTTSGYTFISAAEDLVLAIRATDGGVTCFGNCGRFNSVYNGQKNFKKIVWSKGITGFGMGISGNAYYTNLVATPASQTSRVSYDIVGKEEFYIFGGLTAGFGYTYNVEFKLSGYTWPVDIGCTDLSCVAIYAKMPKPDIYSIYTSNETKLLQYDFVSWIYNTGEVPTKALIEYSLNGTNNYLPTKNNSFLFKSHWNIWSILLQYLTNKDVLKYNNTTGRYYLDWTGTTFDTNTYTTTADLLDHAGKNYTRNTNHWLQALGDIDISCIPVWQSTRDTGFDAGLYGGIRPEWTRGGCLITPQHLACASHFPIPIGSTVRWVTMDNQVIERTVIDSQDFANDVTICLLDSAVDSSIKIPKIWDQTYNSTWTFYSDPTDPNGSLQQWSYGLKSDQYRRLVPVAFTIAPGIVTLQGAQQSAIFGPNIIGSKDMGNRDIIMLDSGSPMFYVDNNELIYVGHITTYGGGGTITQTKILGVTENTSSRALKTLCNQLSLRNGKIIYPIVTYKLSGSFDNENDYNTLLMKQIKTNKKNIFLSKQYTKATRIDYDSHANNYQLGIRYSSFFVPKALFKCYGPDANVFTTMIPGVDPNKIPLNYCPTKNNIFIINYTANTVELSSRGGIVIWNNNGVEYGAINKSISGSTNLFPVQTTSFDSSNNNKAIHEITSDLLLAGGSNHAVMCNRNKLRITGTNYLQVTSVDSAFKRIFVKDLNGNMISYINGDPISTRFSIIRKNADGYYDIIKINNNCLKGIITSKALRIISKYYDVGNLNPSNENQWNDYLDLLTRYHNDTLITGGSLPTINKINTGNPVEIKYYEKQYIEDLISKLPRILTQ